MGHELADDELELYRRVDEVLFYVWDPIGVATSPTARDEYYGYLPIVFSMLQGEGANASIIAAYLDSIASERMGLDANPEHSKRVAQLLLDWKPKSEQFLHGRSEPTDQLKPLASIRLSFHERPTAVTLPADANRRQRCKFHSCGQGRPFKHNEPIRLETLRSASTWTVGLGSKSVRDSSANRIVKRVAGTCDLRNRCERNDTRPGPERLSACIDG